MTLLGENRDDATTDANGAEDVHDPRPPDLAIRDRRFDEHHALARSLARRMHRDGTSLDDLEQVASEALLAAIERFDPSYGVPIGAFATATILGTLKRYYRDSGWSVRVPRQVHELASPLARAGDELRQQLGREPSTVELARALDTDVEQVSLVQRATHARHTYSLDAPLPGHDGAGRDPTDRLGQIDGAFSRSEARIDLTMALRALPARDRALLTDYFVHERSQSAIAADHGISQMQVSRMIAVAVGRLRSRMQITRGAG